MSNDFLAFFLRGGGIVPRTPSNRYMKNWIWLPVLVGLFGSTGPAMGAGVILVDEAHGWPGPNPPRPAPPPWPPGPMPVRRPHPFAPLAVSFVKIHTRITDQVAVTSVDQEFCNPNPARLEGTFVFPLPKGAHIDAFAMEIDGRQVQAELLSAEKARRIYEDIVRKLRDPALLEYVGRDVFQVRVFPIEPNSRKRVALRYTELLKAESGLISFVLPLDTERFSAAPIGNVSVKVDLETKRPLKSIYSPTHAVEINRLTPTTATAGFEAAQVRAETDFALYFAPEKDELGVNLLTHRSGAEDGSFLLLASPGLGAQESQVVLKDVALVLDTSGSMAGKKLEQAKKALAFCVENLNPGDRFEVIRFSTEVEPLFGGLVAASKQNRTRAESFIKDLRAMGATALDEALKKALQLRAAGKSEARTSGSEVQTGGPASGGPAKEGGERPFAVIFLTDGQPTIGTTDPEEILAGVKRANAGRARIFCFGIGADVNTHLLDRIAEETRASSQYVLPEEDLEVKLSSFYSKIKEPVLANPTLKFTAGIHVKQLYPSALPDLFTGEQLVLAGRYSGQGPSAVVIEGTVNGTTRHFTYEVAFPEQSPGNEFIPRLWATRRVGYLLDEIRLHGDNAELRDETTELARQYGIVTPYTAYLIMEDETLRNVPAQARSLYNLETDRGARQEASQSWRQFTLQAAGESAVADARYGSALRLADAPGVAHAQAAAAFARRYGVAGGVAPAAGAPSSAPAATPLPVPSDKDRLVQYSGQAQFVAGKNFFWSGKQWMDSALQKAPGAKRLRLQFGSPEYFDFSARNPKANPWLALGQDLSFVLDDTIYEVYE